MGGKIGVARGVASASRVGSRAGCLRRDAKLRLVPGWSPEPRCALRRRKLSKVIETQHGALEDLNTSLNTMEKELETDLAPVSKDLHELSEIHNIDVAGAEKAAVLVGKIAVDSSIGTLKVAVNTTKRVAKTSINIAYTMAQCVLSPGHAAAAILKVQHELFGVGERRICALLRPTKAPNVCDGIVLS